MTENTNEIYNDIASYKWNIEEIDDTIRELNRKIEDLTEDYNYLRKVRQEKSDYINKKIVDCSELISNIRGCGILGMLCNVRDSYNKLSEIDDAYTEQLEIIKENINYYQDEVRKEKNEILQLEYKIENCYREIEESKG